MGSAKDKIKNKFYLDQSQLLSLFLCVNSFISRSKQ